MRACVRVCERGCSNSLFLLYSGKYIVNMPIREDEVMHTHITHTHHIIP